MPLKLGVSSLGEPTISSFRYVPSGVLFPPRTKGDVPPARGDLRSAGRGGTGLMGIGGDEYTANCSTSSSMASSSRHSGGETEGEKFGGSGGAGSSGGGPSTIEGGESGGEKGGGDPGESNGGEGGGSLGGGPGERQGVEGVEEGVSGAGESGGGGGGSSSGGGGLSSLKVTHRGETYSSLVRGLSEGPKTSSRSGAGEPL